MERIDLHVHTLASDGSDAPETVVRKAAAAGLRAVAITDHDTFAGLPEALAAGTARGIEVVPGVELSTVWGGEGGAPARLLYGHGQRRCAHL